VVCLCAAFIRRTGLLGVDVLYFELFVRFTRTRPLNAHFFVNATLNVFATCPVRRSVLVFEIGTAAQPRHVVRKTVVNDLVRYRGCKFKIGYLVDTSKLAHVDERATGGYLKSSAWYVSTLLTRCVVRIETRV